MTVSAAIAASGFPVQEDMYITVHASGTGLVVNPGDWVIFSGSYGIASEDADAYFKVSGAGVALDCNPVFDQFGRQVVNSALLVATRGLFLFSAAFSGSPLLGLPVYPVTTGSGVKAPSGVTGVGATWNTATPQSLSGLAASASASASPAPNLGVGQLLAWRNPGNAAGTGQLLVRVWSPRNDYY